MKTVNGLKPLAIFAKKIHLRCLGSEFASDLKYPHEEYIYLTKDVVLARAIYKWI